MRRYWIEKSAIVGNEIHITGDELHHIRDVCRMGIGDKFELLCEGQKAYLVSIVTESKKESIAQILEERLIPELPKPHIILALSIPRMNVYENVLEKAVELGVHSIQPLFSDYSFLRKQDDVLEKKAHRFEKIIKGATQQTGRGEMMKIEPPQQLGKFLENFNRNSDSWGLMAYEGETEFSFRKELEVQAENLKNIDKLYIFVGSEGGFSTQEKEMFEKHSMKALSLGSQVLRVETACVALISIIKYELQLY